MKCLSTFICCGWAHGWNLKLLCLWRYWLRIYFLLTASHDNIRYVCQVFSTFICGGWAYGWTLRLLHIMSRWGAQFQFCNIAVRWGPNDSVMSWLRLQTLAVCIPHPYWIYELFEHIHMLWLGLWVQPYCNTCAGGVRLSQMTLWCHGWGCKRSQAASHIHIGGIWSVWALW